MTNMRTDNFSLSDLADALVPNLKKSIADVTSGISQGSQAAATANESVTFIANNKWKILFGVFVAIVVANIVARMIYK